MIYAGTWKDQEGVPFDNNAKVLQLTPGGGIACTRRRALVAHPCKTPFTSAARNLRDRWWHTLEQWMRDYWWNDGLVGSSKRGSLDRTPTQGFIHFQAAAFAKQWLDPPTDLDYIQGWPDQTWTSASIDSISIPNQTVTFTCQYTDKMHLCLDNNFVTYQIRPSKIHASNPWRATRMIDLARMTSADPTEYSTTVPLAWKARTGDLIRLYFRGRSLHHYSYQHTDTYQT